MSDAIQAASLRNTHRPGNGPVDSTCEKHKENAAATVRFINTPETLFFHPRKPLNKRRHEVPSNAKLQSCLKSRSRVPNPSSSDSMRTIHLWRADAQSTRPQRVLVPNACEDVLFQSILEHVTNTEDVRYVKIDPEPTTLGWGVEKPIKSETIDAYLAWSPHHFQWMRHRMLVPALLQNHHKHSPGAPHRITHWPIALPAQCARDHVLQQALAGEYPDPHMQVHIKTGGCLWPENDTRVRDLHSGILVEATWGHIPAPVHFTPSAGSRPADHVDHTPTESILNRINVDTVLQLTTQVLDPWPNHIISLDTEFRGTTPP